MRKALDKGRGLKRRISVTGNCGGEKRRKIQVLGKRNLEAFIEDDNHHRHAKVARVARQNRRESIANAGNVDRLEAHNTERKAAPAAETTREPSTTPAQAASTPVNDSRASEPCPSGTSEAARVQHEPVATTAADARPPAPAHTVDLQPMATTVAETEGGPAAELAQRGVHPPAPFALRCGSAQQRQNTLILRQMPR